MNILVTGISGLLGSHTAEKLVEQGHRVWGLSRTPPTSMLHNVDYFILDIADKIPHLLYDNFDICIHTAAFMPLNNDLLMQENCIKINTLGTYNLLNYILKKNKSCFFINVSTVYVYTPNPDGDVTEISAENPETLYGLSKLFADNICNNFPINSTILRFSCLYDDKKIAQKHQPALYDFIHRAQRNEEIIIRGNLNRKRNYLHINDAVQAILCTIAQKKTGIYNIASDENLSLMEIAKTIVNTVGSSSNLLRDPSREIYAPFRSIGIEKARHELGFSPCISFQMGIQRVLAYEKKQ